MTFYLGIFMKYYKQLPDNSSLLIRVTNRMYFQIFQSLYQTFTWYHYRLHAAGISNLSGISKPLANEKDI